MSYDDQSVKVEDEAADPDEDEVESVFLVRGLEREEMLFGR